MRIRKSERAKKSAHVKKSPRFTAAIGTWAIILVVICVTGAAMVIAARQPSETPDIFRADAKAERAAQGQPRKAAAARASAAEAVETSTPAGDATAANAGVVASNAKAKPAPVTITGCLERDDKTFRLKDALGEDAPKSRSWKSGFLKKSPASIEVVDASHSLKLPNHVGQRVSLTGVIVDREIQVRSLQRVAASCNAVPKTLGH
jgi:hypothetical protein